MNRMGLALWIGTFLAAGSFAQSRPTAPDLEPGNQGVQAKSNGPAAVATRLTLNATLSAPVDSKKCKAGDTVTARTTEAVKSDGKTVLPKGTKLVGHVTQASAKAKGDSESTIGMLFDKAVLKQGEEMPLSLAIQAIGAAQSNVSAGTPEMGPAGSMGGPPAGNAGGAPGMTGGTGGAVANTASRVGNAAGGAVNSTTNAAGNVAATSQGAVGGLNSAGEFTSNSRGVFGLDGLSLSATSGNNTQGSVIASTGKHVQLDGGTRMLLVSQAHAGSGSAAKPSQR